MKRRAPMRNHSGKLNTLNSLLKLLSYVSAAASLLGVSVLGILSRIFGIITDPWTIATGVAVMLLIPLGVLAARGFVTKQVLQAMLGERLHGRSDINRREKELLASASSSVAYIAGDFSHVHEIQGELQHAFNRSVTVRVLGADSVSPTVRANFANALSLHCEVRLYSRDFRRVKALIIDADEANADGSVMFVRKSARHAGIDETGRGIPGSDETFEYVGTVYEDRILVTAIGQMFDAWWEKARPFTA